MNNNVYERNSISAYCKVFVDTVVNVCRLRLEVEKKIGKSNYIERIVLFKVKLADNFQNIGK